MSERTALIVVDVQRAFVDAVGGEGPRVLREVNRYVDEAVRDGMPVVYTRDVEPFAMPDGDPDGVTDLHPELDVVGSVVEKGPGRRGYMSGFLLADATAPGLGSVGPLAAELRAAGVTVAGDRSRVA